MQSGMGGTAGASGWAAAQQQGGGGEEDEASADGGEGGGAAAQGSPARTGSGTAEYRQRSPDSALRNAGETKGAQAGRVSWLTGSAERKDC